MEDTVRALKTIFRYDFDHGNSSRKDIREGNGVEGEVIAMHLAGFELVTEEFADVFRSLGIEPMKTSLDGTKLLLVDGEQFAATLSCFERDELTEDFISQIRTIASHNLERARKQVIVEKLADIDWAYPHSFDHIPDPYKEDRWDSEFERLLQPSPEETMAAIDKAFPDLERLRIDVRTGKDGIPLEIYLRAFQDDIGLECALMPWNFLGRIDHARTIEAMELLRGMALKARDSVSTQFFAEKASAEIRAQHNGIVDVWNRHNFPRSERLYVHLEQLKEAVAEAQHLIDSPEAPRYIELSSPTSRFKLPSGIIKESDTPEESALKAQFALLSWHNENATKINERAPKLLQEATLDAQEQEYALLASPYLEALEQLGVTVICAASDSPYKLFMVNDARMFSQALKDLSKKEIDAEFITHLETVMTHFSWHIFHLMNNNFKAQMEARNLPVEEKGEIMPTEAAPFFQEVQHVGDIVAQLDRLGASDKMLEKLRSLQAAVEEDCLPEYAFLYRLNSLQYERDPKEYIKMINHITEIAHIGQRLIKEDSRKTFLSYMARETTQFVDNVLSSQNAKIISVGREVLVYAKKLFAPYVA